jgi:hypothetical protein
VTLTTDFRRVFGSSARFFAQKIQQRCFFVSESCIVQKNLPSEHPDFESIAGKSQVIIKKPLAGVGVAPYKGRRF